MAVTAGGFWTELISAKNFKGDFKGPDSRLWRVSASWPVKTPQEPRSPMSEAMDWVSRILAVVAVMFLPSLGGAWLDKKLGTGFLGLAGLAAGVVTGVAYLVAITKQPPRGGNRTDQGD